MKITIMSFSLCYFWAFLNNVEDITRNLEKSEISSSTAGIHQ